ncbi:MAG TPA: 50S ribosomal protein L6, partial [Trueperaceae bacterium]|nr:50S ribosomal protein L6 [Trueperaceae bacterium]
MSRIGRAPIALPKGVQTTIGAAGGVEVKGPKGTLSVQVDPQLDISVDDGVLTVARKGDGRDQRAQHGLARALIANAIAGVTEGYVK